MSNSIINSIIKVQWYRKNIFYIYMKRQSIKIMIKISITIMKDQLIHRTREDANFCGELIPQSLFRL